MKYWFTADTHFGHDNIRRLCNRPFATIEEHDEELIARWNSRIEKHDTVYHLGDFVWWRHKDPQFGPKILQRLNGDVLFLKGNHDPSLHELDNLYPDSSWDSYEELYLPDTDEGSYKGKRLVILCHYAFRTWNKAHHGSWHLHGHSHAGLKNDNGVLMTEEGNGRILDVGVDNHNFYPWSWDEVKEYMATRIFKATDHHSGKMKDEFFEKKEEA